MYFFSYGKSNIRLHVRANADAFVFCLVSSFFISQINGVEDLVSVEREEKMCVDE